MQGLLELIQNYAPWLIDHRYLFLFIGSIFEGLNTLVLGGFLVSIGAAKFLPLFLLLAVGHTINGYMWYSVGYFGGAKSLDKWGHRKKLSHEIIEKVTEYFNRYSGRAIVFTKFTFSFEIATLIMAGSLKYNLKNFSKYNFIGSLGWTMITMTVGYVFGQSFNIFTIFIRNLTYLFLFLGGAIVVTFLIKIALKSAFVKSLRFDEKLRKLKEVMRDKLNEFLPPDEHKG